jgi:glucose 1-dehydrogenase
VEAGSLPTQPFPKTPRSPLSPSLILTFTSDPLHVPPHRDQVVLVTGASKGIGRALALGCAREGADVILNYNSDRGGAEAAAAEIRALGRRALFVRADLGRPAQIERMFATARKASPASTC